MGRLGKLLLAVFLSVGVANGASLTKVFGLKDQEFAEVAYNKLNRYKVNDNILVSLRLSKTDWLDGYRTFEGTSGLFALTFKKPYLKNWVYIEDAFYFQRYESFTRYIKFIDENGLELKVTINSRDGDICAGDKCMPHASKDRRAQIKVIFANGHVTYYINDKKLYSSAKRFSKLKKITHDIACYNNGNVDNLVDVSLLEIK